MNLIKSLMWMKLAPKISIAEFFDIIGQINIILRSDTALQIVRADLKFESVSPGILELSKTDSLPVLFEVFTTGDSHSPWIATRFPRIVEFSTFTEYACSLWTCMMSRLSEAQKVLVCPPSVFSEYATPIRQNWDIQRRSCFILMLWSMI